MTFRIGCDTFGIPKEPQGVHKDLFAQARNTCRGFVTSDLRAKISTTMKIRQIIQKSLKNMKIIAAQPEVLEKHEKVLYDIEWYWMIAWYWIVLDGFKILLLDA